MDGIAVKRWCVADVDDYPGAVNIFQMGGTDTMVGNASYYEMAVI